MAAERVEDTHIEEEEVEEGQDDDQFIDPNDVLVEVADDGDVLMDEDEDGFAEGGPQPDEEIVWEDNSMQHFPNHKGSVFTICTHPSAPLAVSGGEDDLGYIWDLTTGDELVKLTGHTDSVTSTAFSSDGELIATGGMDGKVRIWRRVGNEHYKQWEFLTEVSGPDEVMVRIESSIRAAIEDLTSIFSGCGGIPRGMCSLRARTTRPYGSGNVSMHLSSRCCGGS